MHSPTIAIILPVYNGRDFLKQALDSVKAQTDVAWHLIVVNDGSSDGSGDMARALAADDSRITVIDTENRGLSAARNRGIDEALHLNRNGRGISLVTFIDADDMLLNGALHTLLQTIGPDTDMAVGGFTFRADTPLRPLRPSDIRRPSPEALVEETLYQRGAVHAACGKLYNIDLFKSERFTEGLYYEDLDFFYRCCLRCRAVSVIDLPVYFYRQHETSIVHTWNDRRLDVLRVTESLERYMAENRPSLLAAARDRRLSANFNIFIEATRNGRNDIASQCWEYITRHRMASLVNPKVRFKNKAGVLLSLGGRRFFTMISRCSHT